MSLDDAQRQKLLKRVLPALAITVVYFAFIAPKISAKAAKVAEESNRLRGNFISSQATLEQLNKQKQDLLREMAELRRSGGSVSTVQTVRDISFMGEADYAGKAIARLSTILAEHHLHIIEEGRQEWSGAKESLPKSVYELGDPAKSKGSGSYLWRVRFSGAYADVYWALEHLSHDALTIIPVSLDMVPPDGEGDLQWIIQIWI